MASSNSIAIGKQAELFACQFLQAKGLLLIEQNYRCALGEIDLIMQDKDDIVFVEVRSRSRPEFGHALETITYGKRNKLIKTAMHFLQKKHWFDKVSSRFDVVAMHPKADNVQLEWIKNAFSLED